MATFCIGLLVGGVSGILFMAVISAGKIADLEESLDTQIKLRQNRDKFIKKQMEMNLGLKNKIVDLVNNIDFLVNNLSAQKKKIVTNGKSAN